ncbi:SRPBCC family protein [Cumulibacter manganitolerans]|uniref:SRPBCC family protein n=1 Tax=Cumulibacter manganitolerans TaxID=1884992 RepID=UPI00129545BE|nr:SRPBCC family protein [Cumulibacter manganitolerans]
MRSRHLSCVVAASPEAVYRYAADPDNLPRWAAGLAAAEVRRDGDDLVVCSPMGEVRVRFVPRNDHGILDHEVVLPTGERVLNPMRVVAHPHGAEVLFTVRQLGMTDEELERDAAAVERDLDALRRIVESQR